MFGEIKFGLEIGFSQFDERMRWNRVSTMELNEMIFETLATLRGIFAEWAADAEYLRGEVARVVVEAV